VRVYPDTNVLVSAVATRGLCADLFQMILADHELLVGETVLAEFTRILTRKLHLAPNHVSEWVTFLRRQGELIPTGPLLRVKVRDPHDRPILAEAVAGRAHVLVTGDRDLLDLTVAIPLEILSPRAFWDRLRSE